MQDWYEKHRIWNYCMVTEETEDELALTQVTLSTNKQNHVFGQWLCHCIPSVSKKCTVIFWSKRNTVQIRKEKEGPHLGIWCCTAKHFCPFNKISQNWEFTWLEHVHCFLNRLHCQTCLTHLSPRCAWLQVEQCDKSNTCKQFQIGKPIKW